jgi:hypothetical protein
MILREATKKLRWAEQRTAFARGTMFLKRPNSTARLAEL